MSKIGVLRQAEGNRLLFFCPGCKENHMVTVCPAPSPSWDWNGSHEKPTFQPSVLVRGLKTINDDKGEWTGEWERDANGNGIHFVCHSYVTDGKIQFLTDSTHELAGQTVSLKEVP